MIPDEELEKVVAEVHILRRDNEDLEAERDRLRALCLELADIAYPHLNALTEVFPEGHEAGTRVRVARNRIAAIRAELGGKP